MSFLDPSVPDVRLVQNGEYPLASEVSLDWLLLGNGTLDDSEALATAVMVALGTDRLAERDDTLPDPDSTDRRGWWGDLDTELIWGGWPIGTRLWLIKRDKITGAAAARGSTLTRINGYIREAIQPFIDQRIASRMDVRVERVGRERVQALIKLYRGPQLAVDLRYQVLWAGIIES
jgi:phage gp46-like protein